MLKSVTFLKSKEVFFVQLEIHTLKPRKAKAVLLHISFWGFNQMNFPACIKYWHKFCPSLKAFGQKFELRITGFHFLISIFLLFPGYDACSLYVIKTKPQWNILSHIYKIRPQNTFNITLFHNFCSKIWTLFGQNKTHNICPRIWNRI